LVLLVAQGRDQPWRLARGVLLVVGQGLLYAIQLADGPQLAATPTDVAEVDNLALIVIILFALGVARAWEFAGADNPSLLGAIARVVGAPGTRDDPPPDPDHERAA
jgi:hypothetical protein